ncbi:reverse transcriptase domain-containing protein [Aporhodopirellula aestuarii]|nr:reverse transcriptase domain-containing protein [Aporhodopirellula aestuarii]
MRSSKPQNPSANEGWDLERYLEKAWKRVRHCHGAAGIDRVSVQAFGRDHRIALKELARLTRSGEFAFSRLKAVSVPKPDGSLRPLEIPTVRDRVVLQAMRLAVQPGLERHMSPSSYAYRDGRGVHEALAAIRDSLARSAVWIVKTDIRRFFESIDHDHLRRSLHDHGCRQGAHPLLNSALQISSTHRPRSRGVAQGSPLSPLLANASLIEFDREVQRRGGLIRYADDMVISTASRVEAKHALRLAKQQCREMGLQLHPKKTCVIDARKTAFEFLGFEITPTQIRPATRNIRKIEEAIDHWLNPNQRLSSPKRVDRLNAVLRSFVWYYRTTDCDRILLDLDARIRQRCDDLRSKQYPRGWGTKIVQPSRLRGELWHGSKPSHTSDDWSGYG